METVANSLLSGARQGVIIKIPRSMQRVWPRKHTLPYSIGAPPVFSDAAIAKRFLKYA